MKTYKLSGNFCGSELSFHYDSNPTIFHNILSGQSYPIVLQKAKIIIDVGANTGAFAKFMSLQYAEAIVYSYEPDPDTYEILIKNIGDNPRVKAYNFGLFDKDEPSAVFYKHENSTSNSFFHKSDKSILASVASAGDTLKSVNINDIDILKIDTEFCDFQILNSILAAGYSPKLIYIEHHSSNDRELIFRLLAEKYQVHNQKGNINQSEIIFLKKERLSID